MPEIIWQYFLDIIFNMFINLKCRLIQFAMRQAWPFQFLFLLRLRTSYDGIFGM